MQPVAAVFRPWVLGSWFIRGRGRELQSAHFHQCYGCLTTSSCPWCATEGRWCACQLRCFTAVLIQMKTYTHIYLPTQSHMLTHMLPQMQNHQRHEFIWFQEDSNGFNKTRNNMKIITICTLSFLHITQAFTHTHSLPNFAYSTKSLILFLWFEIF